MVRGKLFNLSNLSSNEVDFYNYCLKNVDNLVSLTLRDIAEQYGCGISFIYKYFEKLNISGLKEYIFLLGYLNGFNATSETIAVESETKKEENLNADNEKILKIEDDILMNYRLTCHNNFNVLKNQTDGIIELSHEIKNASKIYGFGLGHSYICLDDLFGMFKIFGLNAEAFNKETFETLLNKRIHSEDIFLVYSMRGNNKYLAKFMLILKKIASENKIFLVTSNPKSKIISQVEKAFFICNNTRQTDYLNNPLLVSSASPFLFFNDFLKNIYYLENKELIANEEIFIEELEAWRDISKFNSKD